MLDKGIIERIVLDYKDILKQATEDNLKNASELPYFEGMNLYFWFLGFYQFFRLQVISGQMSWKILSKKSKWNTRNNNN